VIYDDQYFDKIKDYERNLRSSFWLMDNVKSIHVIETNSENERQSSIKYTYDSNKKIVNLTNYNSELEEVMNRNYYHYGNYEGESILKDGYSELNPNKRKDFTSQIDESEKLIIVETIENDMTISIDSILYQNNHLPTLIKKYDSSNKLQYIQKLEYSGEKISLNLTLRTSGVNRGSKRDYNNQNKHISVSPLSNIIPQKMEFNVDTTKTEITEWKGNDFKYLAGTTDVYEYNSKTNILKRDVKTHTYSIIFNENLSPTYIEYINKETRKGKSIKYAYNDFDDVLSKTYEKRTDNDEEEFYEYEYDKRQNWTKRKMYINNLLFKVTERIIEYY